MQKKPPTLLFILLILISITACRQKKDDILLTGKIEYSVTIQQCDPSLEWWNQNIKGENRDRMIEDIFSAAATGKYALEDINHNPLNPAKLSDIYSVHQVVHLHTGEESHDTDLSLTINFRNIQRILFREAWNWDTVQLKLDKKILAICPVAVIYDPEGVEIFSKPLFWIFPDTLNSKASQRQITKRIMYMVPIKSIAEHANWWEGNIEEPMRSVFQHSLTTKALSGTFRLFDGEYSPITAPDLKSRLYYNETLRVENPNPPYDERDTLIRHEFNVTEIQYLRFIEEWTFSPNSLQFEKKIIGFAPVIKSYDEKNEFRGLKILFWIFFNEAYPTALNEKP